MYCLLIFSDEVGNDPFSSFFPLRFQHCRDHLKNRMSIKKLHDSTCGQIHTKVRLEFAANILHLRGDKGMTGYDMP